MKRYKIIIICIITLLLAGGAAGIYYRDHYSHQPPSISQSDSPTGPTAAQCIAKLPASLKIGQKLMFAGYATKLNGERAALAKAHIGGVIMMDNVSPATTRSLVKSITPAPFIATDEEGGSVMRYPLSSDLPGQAAMVSNYSPQQAYQMYKTAYQQLRSAGITTNFAPIVDVISRQPNPLPGRLYSDNPNIVTDYAQQSIKAAFDTGITPVVKHFPGLGSASGNTDYGSATTDSLATLKQRDLVPYRRLASLSPDIMVGNMIVPGLTKGQPASLSKPAISLLRSYGYDNAVIYTDSLTANAIPGSLYDAVIAAWSAGADVALIVQTKPQTPRLASYISHIQDQAQAAIKQGELDESQLDQSVARIFDRKDINPCQL